MFDYDPHEALETDIHAIQKHAGVTIHDLTYASPKGGRVTAYLISPSGAGPFAGIIFLHPGTGGNRATFLAEAIVLAKQGGVCLCLDAPFTRPAPWNRPGGTFSNPEAELEKDIQTVIDLRRAVDLLTTRVDVDPQRIGYVGHSYGATWGGVLASVERRITAYILMAGEPSLSTFWRTSDSPLPVHMRARVPADVFDRYLTMISPLDAVHYIGHAAPATLFFQFARYDPFITEAAALRYYTAASEPKHLHWYVTGHELNSAEAFTDRVAWLSEQLAMRR